MPLLPPPVLLGPFEPEKNLVTSSDMSGSSGLGLSMFMDCSISCRERRGMEDERTIRKLGRGGGVEDKI